MDLEVEGGSEESLGRRGEVGEVGEELRGELPNRSPLSGTSSARLLLTAGLGRGTLGWPVVSKTLP